MTPYNVGLVLAVLFGLCEVRARKAVIQITTRGGKCILQVTHGTPLSVVWEALALRYGGPVVAKVRGELERGELLLEWV